MIARLAAFAWLLFIWLALVGLSPASLVVGAAASAILLAFFRPRYEKARTIYFRPLPAARFVVYFLIKFIEANVQVGLAVIDPERVRHRRAVIAAPIVGASQSTTLLLANAVTLTPGTYVLEIRSEPPTLYVHVLQLASLREARLAILELERRIVDAIGPPGSTGRVDALMANLAADGSDRGAA